MKLFFLIIIIYFGILSYFPLQVILITFIVIIIFLIYVFRKIYKKIKTYIEHKNMIKKLKAEGKYEEYLETERLKAEALMEQKAAHRKKNEQILMDFSTGTISSLKMLDSNFIRMNGNGGRSKIKQYSILEYIRDHADELIRFDINDDLFLVELRYVYVPDGSSLYIDYGEIIEFKLDMFAPGGFRERFICYSEPYLKKKLIINSNSGIVQEIKNKSEFYFFN